MIVFVAGASGALGGPLSRQLLEAGHTVIGLTRTPANAERLRAAGVRPVVADAMDRQDLLRAVADLQADAVVHVLTALKKTPLRHADLRATDALRTTGTTNVIEATRALGARRLVSESFIKGYGFGDFGDRVLTEADPFAPPTGGPYGPHLDALRSAEEQTFGADGVDGVALRFGYLYGPGASTAEMLAMLRAHRFPVPRDGGGVNSYVYVDDAASAIIAALERGRPGTAYNIADEEPVSWGTFLDRAAELFGVPRPMHVPGVLLRALPYAHAIVANSARLSNERATSELGWRPTAPTYVEGLARTRDALRAIAPGSSG